MNKLSNRENSFLLITYLNNELLKRKKNNSKYSLRAYARDLSIDASLLSKILRNKLPLSDTLTDKFCRGLHLSKDEEQIVIDDIEKIRAHKRKNFVHNFETFQIPPDDCLFAAALFINNRRSIALYGTFDCSYKNVKNILQISKKTFVLKLKRLEEIGFLTLGSLNQVLFLDYSMFQMSTSFVPDKERDELRKLTHFNTLNELQQAASSRYTENPSSQHFNLTTYSFGIQVELIEEFKLKLQQATKAVVAEFVDKSKDEDVCLTLVESYYSIDDK